MPNKMAKPAACSSSSAADDDDCAICGDGNVYEGNEIIFCDGCDVAVHQLCYDIQEIPGDDEKFYCCCCELELQDADVACELCPVRKAKAPMRPVQGRPGTFVHSLCASYFPLCESKRGHGGLVQINTSKLSMDNGYFCILCHRSSGVPVRCVGEGCTKYFHPMCALMNPDAAHSILRGYNPENIPVLACREHKKSFQKACLAEGEALEDRFSRGDAVDVRYHGGKFWFRGVIVRRGARHRYHVRYLDGEEEQNVERHNIRIRDAVAGENGVVDDIPVSPEDGTDSADEDIDDASDYERIRLENVRRNQNFLATLGLKDTTSSARRTKSRRKNTAPLCPRRSKRANGVLSHTGEEALKKAREREARRLEQEMYKQAQMAKIRERHHKALQMKIQRQEKLERKQMECEDRLSRKLRRIDKIERQAKVRKEQQDARDAYNEQKRIKKQLERLEKEQDKASAKALKEALRRAEATIKKTDPLGRLKGSVDGPLKQDRNVDPVYEFEDSAWRSVADDVSCAFCGGKENDLDSCEGGFVLPPFRGPKNEMVWVHANCATYTPEVYVSSTCNAYCNVLNGIKRGKKNKCALEGCGRRGASIGCYVQKCKRSYHLPCALATGWSFRGMARFWCEEHREGNFDASDDSPIEHGPLTGVYCKFCNDPDPKMEDLYVSCTADACNTTWHMHCAGLSPNDVEKIETWLCQPCQIQREEDEAVYCICRKRAQEDEVYLGCEGCQDWFHPRCLNLSDAEVDAIGKSDAEWFCPSCVERLKIICVCRKHRSPRENPEDLVACSMCELEFHRSCVGVAHGESYVCVDCGYKHIEEKVKRRAKPGKEKRSATPTAGRRLSKRLKLVCKEPEMPSPLSAELAAVVL